MASKRDDDGDDFEPKNKKKKPGGGEAWEYKSSWMRYAVLGVLVVVLGVLGVLLYLKKQREKEDARTTDSQPAITRTA